MPACQGSERRDREHQQAVSELTKHWAADTTSQASRADARRENENQGKLKHVHRVTVLAKELQRPRVAKSPEPASSFSPHDQDEQRSRDSRPCRVRKPKPSPAKHFCTDRYSAADE